MSLSITFLISNLGFYKFIILINIIYKILMHLRFTLDKDGKRIYTLKQNIEEKNEFTLNAHPGLFNFNN